MDKVYKDLRKLIGTKNIEDISDLNLPDGYDVNFVAEDEAACYGMSGEGASIYSLVNIKTGEKMYFAQNWFMYHTTEGVKSSFRPIEKCYPEEIKKVIWRRKYD